MGCLVGYDLNVTPEKGRGHSYYFFRKIYFLLIQRPIAKQHTIIIIIIWVSFTTSFNRQLCEMR